MGMNVGSSGGDEDEIVSTINTTPLVDVMLVLLIIFLITIPVVTTSIPVTAAEGTQRGPRDQAGEHRHLGRCGGPHLLERTADHEHRGADRPAEEDRRADAAARGADPRRRRREATTRVGRIIYACQRAGIAKVGFITEPPVRGG